MPWLESDTPQSQHVVGDSPIHPFGLSIETDKVGSISRDIRIIAPDRHILGRFNVARESIAAGVSAYINDDGPPMSINFSMTDA